MPVAPGNVERSFEAKPHILNMLPTFHGKGTEEPYAHIADFEAVCGMIAGHGFMPDQVKLVLFQFSLKDAARDWFTSLPYASIYTWQELQQQFLDEYYTPQRTKTGRLAIREFQQLPGELLYESWKGFNQLIRNCPHHGIQRWELITAFHDGISNEDRRDIKAITGGAFLKNHVDVDWDYLDIVAADSKRQAQSDRNKKYPIVAPSSAGASNARVAQLEREKEALERQLAKFKGLGARDALHAAQTFPVCDSCGELGHTLDVCPVQFVAAEEDVNMVYGEQKSYDMNSNTYHPGLRNHPNFRYSNTSNQLNPTFQVPNQGNQQYQNRQPNYNKNYNQGGYNPGNQRTYQQNQDQSKSNNQSEVSNSEVMEMLKQIKKDQELQAKAYQSLEKQVAQLAVDVKEVRRDPGKLPSDTTKNPQHHARVNSVSTVPNSDTVNTDLTFSSQVVTGISDGSEESELGAPHVPIKVGKLKIHKALLDYGASKNILPGSLFDQYEFGPLHEFNRKVILADDTWKQPRGVVKDVKIQLGEFYYSVDFLVLDYAPTRTNEQQKVILGRPFLHTVNAQINCREGLIMMSFENRKLIFNVYSKSITYEIINSDEAVATDEIGIKCDRSRHVINEETVRKANVKKKGKMGKPPDGGNTWREEAKVELNARDYANFPDCAKLGELEKSGRKHIFEPP
ncbi:uncharacterized protein LOC110911218 [Helianthus annuus]|uniref:uncharacterized protein LOC110911218 n=1 Tax=Helianthus annuus TaxID=4232 RepID=UPI000B8F122A|nr:uncharacterized protein LOC110911218 [Helianthus annuus]